MTRRVDLSAQAAAESRARAERSLFLGRLEVETGFAGDRLRDVLGIPPELEISYSREPVAAPVVVTVVVNPPEPGPDRS